MQVRQRAYNFNTEILTLIKSISGIRGTIGGKVGEGLSPIDVVKFAAAYGKWVSVSASPSTEKNADSTPLQNPKIIIGRDARVSGQLVSQLVSSTLQSMGFDVIDLGLSTTPTVEMAVPMENASGGIILTASHNPGNWNALKLLNQKGEFISAQEGEDILKFAKNDDFEFVKVSELGSYKTDDTYIQKHIEKILELPLVDVEAIKAKGFKIAVDGVNSTGGIAIPMLLEALGVTQIDKFFCEPTGIFQHNPEPLPENLTHICSTIKTGNYNLGIVVDPDVDRLALICEDGTPFGEEYTLVTIADYILQHQVGNTVSNLSSTQALKDVTLKAGGKYFAAAVGEVNVVEKMKECNAIIGGEGNGGIIYPELHYGRDALVGIALFLTQLAKFKGTAKMLRSKYPSYHISKNKIELTPEISVDNVLEEILDKYKNYPVNTIDGVKIQFDSEWVHLRKSNTEPIIRIYSESQSEATAEHLAQKIMHDIKEIITQ
ncbi:phosphoglucosamine mutase [Bernardetia litoralis DSM 6794]|uniref:Phosphoglucosamine mutase n=1 Tax=Bernardetia litoralis (strain ATCC 23117 / DSM 6794 / NBRC 15988 / NCIMB 1366 / Fx l1 / Sio-4) TaxID=880071 RepID=I4AJ43_BERLS|nr:phosphoglucosamine mutase [Bernardetia litoralis DSM 6794]